MSFDNQAVASEVEVAAKAKVSVARDNRVDSTSGKAVDRDLRGVAVSLKDVPAGFTAVSVALAAVAVKRPATARP